MAKPIVTTAEDGYRSAQPILQIHLVWERQAKYDVSRLRVTQGPGRRGQRMAADYSICLGTAGWGVWHSPDAGKSWIRHRAPFPLNSRIQALAAHPKEAHTVLAVTIRACS
jgi:hypothetical protein